MDDYYRAHSCEEFDGECEGWTGYHGNRGQAYAPWERELLGLNDGMKLVAHLVSGQQLAFTKVSVDSTRIVSGTLTFERDDQGGAKVEIVTIPNVVYWTTN